MKRISQLSPKDFRLSPVWEFVDDDQYGDCVMPLAALPVKSLERRVVGLRVRLNNGRQVWAILGNASLSSARATEQFLTLAVERNGSWFDMARYHDVDYEQRGPKALARFLALPLIEVFPISVDLSGTATGQPECLKFQIEAEPKELLSEKQRLALAVE